MSQEKEWDREYKRSTFLTKENKPQTDVVRFVKFLEKQKKVDLNLSDSVDWKQTKVLDLGCGTGRNSFYFAELGADVTGFEISQTALDIARQNLAKQTPLTRVTLVSGVKYQKRSIGEEFPIPDQSIDLCLDVTSSNSLGEKEREVFLSEVHRVLKDGGYFFVKALCKDGDQNAKNLLKKSPGREKDTYILPDTGITEKVFSKEDFLATYEKYFKIIHLEKKTSYTTMSGRLYKRNFWIGYLVK